MMRLPFDPTKEIEFKATVPVRVEIDGLIKFTGTEERTYRLRFAMRELHQAEGILGIKTVQTTDGERGVDKLIRTLTDGSLDKLLTLFGIMASRHRPDGISIEEMYDVADANLDGLIAACYGVLGKTLPQSDPKEPAPPIPSGEPVAMAEGT